VFEGDKEYLFKNVPPIPRPVDNLRYLWSGPNNKWFLPPDYPAGAELGSMILNFTSLEWEPNPAWPKSS
jgi:hypothetical protein